MRVFVDACVWLQAFIYPGRQSGEFLSTATKKRAFTLVISKSVIRELSKHVVKKAGEEAHIKLIRMIKSGLIEYMANSLTLADLEKWKDIIAERDRHVLAGAFLSRADALVSVDFDHVITPNVKEHFPIPVFDPRNFLEWFNKNRKRRLIP